MNPVFRVVLQKARKLITNPNKARKVMDDAINKSNRIKGDKSFITEMRENISLFFSMLADFFSGKYRKIPLKTGIKLLGALLYFVFIIDLIPDFLAVVGFTDDAAVLAWVINSIGGDIDKYKAWKEKKNQEELLKLPE